MTNAAKNCGLLLSISSGYTFGTAPEDRTFCSRLRATDPTWNIKPARLIRSDQGKIKQGKPGWGYCVTLAPARGKCWATPPIKSAHAIEQARRETRPRDVGRLSQGKCAARVERRLAISGGGR